METNMSLFRFFLLWAAVATLLFAAGLSHSAIAAPASLAEQNRMDALIQFAETILEHGRDTYGEEGTPLFSDYLEVSPLKAPEKMYIHRLGGPGPRSQQPFQRSRVKDRTPGA